MSSAFCPGDRIRYRRHLSTSESYVGTIARVRPSEVDIDETVLEVSCEHKQGTHYVELGRSVVEVLP